MCRGGITWTLEIAKCVVIYLTIQIQPLCPQCNKKLEERFQDVKEYIRENPGAGMATVAEDTGVPVQQLKNGFVRSVWPLPRVPESR